jgi:5'-methylthioinosine phosphorylase
MLKAIIGGTGVYNVAEEVVTKTIDTEYGKAFVDIAKIDGEEIVFLARHGKEHSVPPHLINYRANMKALEKLGVKYIYATAAVGSCNPNFEVGDVVVINDFLDFTKVRPITFYEGGEAGVIHTDLSDSYCSNLRRRFYEEAEKVDLHIKGEGVYVCTQGPRFESAAEVKFYRSIGGDVIGMTNVPEVTLAKELGMCYATVGIVTNFCTGMGGNSGIFHDIKNTIGNNKEKVMNVFLNIFKGNLGQEQCRCNKSTMRL